MYLVDLTFQLFIWGGQGDNIFKGYEKCFLFIQAQPSNLSFWPVGFGHFSPFFVINPSWDTGTLTDPGSGPSGCPLETWFQEILSWEVLLFRGWLDVWYLPESQYVDQSWGLESGTPTHGGLSPTWDSEPGCVFWAMTDSHLLYIRWNSVHSSSGPCYVVSSMCVLHRM